MVLIVKGGSDKVNRATLENKRVDILLSPESGRGDDLIHCRNSGLNQVLCALARRNDIAIGFNFCDILNSKERDKLIGRMMQNIRLCRKFKVKMVFDCFTEKEWEKREKRDLFAFAQVLGMSPGEAKNALDFKVEKNEDIKIIE